MKRKSIVLSLVLSVLVLNLAGCGGGGGGSGPVVVVDPQPTPEPTPIPPVEKLTVKEVNDALLKQMKAENFRFVLHDSIRFITEDSFSMESVFDYSKNEISAIEVSRNPFYDSQYHPQTIILKTDNFERDGDIIKTTFDGGDKKFTFNLYGDSLSYSNFGSIIAEKFSSNDDDFNTIQYFAYGPSDNKHTIMNSQTKFAGKTFATVQHGNDVLNLTGNVTLESNVGNNVPSNTIVLKIDLDNYYKLTYYNADFFEISGQNNLGNDRFDININSTTDIIKAEAKYEGYSDKDYYHNPYSKPEEVVGVYNFKSTDHSGGQISINGAFGAKKQ
ncbi:MAG: hypothetical protein Ta2D_13190 [Rickettsiales bacterium]|nr:MAG: hypothetical protein Ta2D_13190 [Rickettsiales bacterium]